MRGEPRCNDVLDTAGSPFTLPLKREISSNLITFFASRSQEELVFLSSGQEKYLWLLCTEAYLLGQGLFFSCSEVEVILYTPTSLRSLPMCQKIHFSKQAKHPNTTHT